MLILFLLSSKWSVPGLGPGCKVSHQSVTLLTLTGLEVRPCEGLQCCSGAAVLWLQSGERWSPQQGNKVLDCSAGLLDRIITIRLGQLRVCLRSDQLRWTTISATNKRFNFHNGPCQSHIYQGEQAITITVHWDYYSTYLHVWEFQFSKLLSFSAAQFSTRWSLTLLCVDCGVLMKY